MNDSSDLGVSGVNGRKESLVVSSLSNTSPPNYFQT